MIPTIHARVGETLLLHGARGNRMLKALVDGTPCCVTVTLVDELVLARAALHHSLNYRSVMVLGRASEVTDPGESRRPFVRSSSTSHPGGPTRSAAPTRPT